MHTIDPIFVAPRYVARDWGRRDLGDWLAGHPTPPETVGEVWVHDAANGTRNGPLGRRLSASSADMLGDLGRAPPKVRLVFAQEQKAVRSTAPLSLWTILEPGLTTEPEREQAVIYRPGDRIRAYEGAEVTLAEESVALEVSSAFLPKNDADDPWTVRLPPVTRRTRATMLREDGLSVELWTLPAYSSIVPDGETCHVITALSRGVAVDGRALAPGEATFVPACGRPIDLTGEGAKVMVAYPDRAPTEIWKHCSGPDPVASQLPLPALNPSSAATLGHELMDIAA
ncbi:MAG TPA: hypothetical protein VG942_02975 [Hyphomonadaceae bacterium]|nr:hypothetical protein [Hyphomonadaceae bacterium]